MKTIGMWLILAALVALSACKSKGPTRSAEDAADEITAHLAADRREEADDVYKAVSSSERHRDVIYSTLWTRASERYDESDFASAAKVFGFLAEHYPRSTGAREALLYALVLERAGKPDVPTDKELAAMRDIIEDLRKREKQPPVWLDLAAAQVEIDQGQLATARLRLERFKAGWDGSPAELHAYVTELDRYLDSHVSVAGGGD